MKFKPWVRTTRVPSGKNIIDRMKVLATILTGLCLLVTSAVAQIDEIDSLQFYDNDYYEVEYDAPNDSSLVNISSFDEEKLSNLRSDADLNYKEPPTIAESLWQRLLMWLAQILGRILEGATSTNWGRVFVYAAALVGLIIVVLMLLKVDAFKIFYSGADSGSVSTRGLHENIHEMNFDELIQGALQKQRYREGIRLLFLYALKVLTDGHHLDWQPGKTNHDYVNELTKGELKTNLNELSFYFDYAWYGNFSVQESTFKKTEALFRNIKEKASS